MGSLYLHSMLNDLCSLVIRQRHLSAVLKRKSQLIPKYGHFLIALCYRMSNWWTLHWGKSEWKILWIVLIL
jgi:hypothetical protein